MPVKKDLSDLPAAPKREGRLASRNPFVLRPLVEHFEREYHASGRSSYELAIPEAGPYRASMSGMRCDRQLWYALTGTPESNPMTIADIWRTTAGSMVHTLLGDAYDVLNAATEAEDHNPDTNRPWRTEVDVDLNPVGIPGSAHGDLVEFIGDKPETVVELKSINGFSYKKVATNFKGPAQGPRWGHIMQGLITAAALQAPRLVVAYVSLELLSPEMATSFAAEGDPFLSELSRFGGEWHFDVPTLQPVVEHEAKRINRVLGLVDEDIQPAREIHDPEFPVGLTVTDPIRKGAAVVVNAEGKITDTGKYWGCAYCAFRNKCASDGQGAITTVEDVMF